MSADQKPSEGAALIVERNALSLRLDDLDARLQRELRLASDAVRGQHAAEFGDEIKKAQARISEISRRLDELRVEAARAADSKFPEGMRLVQWEQAHYHARALSWRPLGKIGVVEIFTAASEHRSYGLPSVGSRCIRILKKNGSPSLSVERIQNDALPYGWYPEGVDPNVIKGKES